MHDNIADKNPDIEDIQNLFRRQGLYENLPLGFDGFLMVPAASIPIVAARTLLSVFRVRFFPVNMHNWDRFAITYKNVIINS
jgi:hypothetical protein